jgi:hypothetical protein
MMSEVDDAARSVALLDWLEEQALPVEAISRKRGETIAGRAVA